jgi:hypothetical protein
MIKNKKSPKTERNNKMVGITDLKIGRSNYTYI